MLLSKICFSPKYASFHLLHNSAFIVLFSSLDLIGAQLMLIHHKYANLEQQSRTPVNLLHSTNALNDALISKQWSLLQYLYNEE